MPRAEAEAVDYRARLCDALGQPQFAEDVHAVGSDGECAADLGFRRVGLEDRRLVARFLQEQCGGRTCNASANNDCARCRCHNLAS